MVARIFLLSSWQIFAGTSKVRAVTPDTTSGTIFANVGRESPFCTEIRICDTCLQAYEVIDVSLFALAARLHCGEEKGQSRTDYRMPLQRLQVD